MKKVIEFDPDDLVEAVESFARQVSGKEKLTLKTREVRLPPAIKPIGPKEIVAIRASLSASQAVFARLLNVPKVTAISWEKGRRKPTGPPFACSIWHGGGRKSYRKHKARRSAPRVAVFLSSRRGQAHPNSHIFRPL